MTTGLPLSSAVIVTILGVSITLRGLSIHLRRRRSWLRTPQGCRSRYKKPPSVVAITAVCETDCRARFAPLAEVSATIPPPTAYPVDRRRLTCQHSVTMRAQRINNRLVRHLDGGSWRTSDIGPSHPENLFPLPSVTPAWRPQFPPAGAHASGRLLVSETLVKDIYFTSNMSSDMFLGIHNNKDELDHVWNVNDTGHDRDGKERGARFDHAGPSWVRRSHLSEAWERHRRGDAGAWKDHRSKEEQLVFETTRYEEVDP